MTPTSASHNAHQDTAIVAAARQLWREQLAKIPDSAAYVTEQQQFQMDYGVQMQGKPIVGVAEPLFLSHSQSQRDQAVVDAVSQSLVAAGAAATSNASLQAHYLPGWGNDPVMQQLIDADPGYATPIVIGRFDMVMTRDGLKVMEFNGGLPGGLLAASLIPDYLKTWPTYQYVAQQFDLSVPPVMDLTLDGLAEVWREFSGEELDWIAVVTPSELHSLVALTVNRMQTAAHAHGIEVVIVEPSELSYADGQLSHNGRAVQLVIRGFLTGMFTSLGDRIKPLLQGVLDEKVCMVASAKSGMYGFKSLFAIVTDDSIELDLDPEVRAHAQAHMPWTRMVSDTTTTGPHGETIQLADFIAREQQSLVIKPSSGFGGFEVTLGWTTSAEQWHQTIAKAIASGGYVVQHRLDMAPQQFSLLAPGFPVENIIADYNPMVINEKIIGYFVRQATTGGLTNISSGDGSVIPVIDVAERS